MKDHFMLSSIDARQSDLDCLTALGITLTPKPSGDYILHLPDGWQAKQHGCTTYLVQDSAHQPVFTYLKGTGLFFRQ